jgi:hypothetical protein
MPEGDGFQISPEELESHEEDVRELMSSIQGATSSAFQPIDINAFGVIGSTWSWALQYWTDAADNAIKQAVGAGNHVADQLKEMRTSHVENDRAGAERFNQIRGE